MVDLFKRKRKKEVKTYPCHTSIKTLSIYTFYEVLNTGNTKLLYIQEQGKEDLEEVWKDIYNQYCLKAKIDNRHLKQAAKVDFLVFKYNRIRAVLASFMEMNTENKKEAIEILKKDGYLIDISKPLEAQFKRIKSQLSALATKIKIEEAKLPKEDKKEAISLIKQKLSLEKMTPGIKIDLKNETVEEWLERLEMAQEEIKFRKSQADKIKK